VVAQISRHYLKERISFIGPATFTTKVTKHIIEVVLPTADHILTALKLPKYSYELSVSNLGAASLNDIGITISGYSADISVLLAILATSLQIHIPEDIVCTGHIASCDGDIRMVKGLPAKLKAAEKAGSIQTFVHPEVDYDKSLKHLTPAEEETISDALSKAKDVIRTVPNPPVSPIILY
jgi:predicted ATP-dependent protease